MEKILLIKIYDRNLSPKVIENEIEEMKNLLFTAGGEVIDVILYDREKVTPSFYIGKGKAIEISEKYKNIDAVAFDIDLIKPVQIRNLEKVINKRILDRTQIILDIFAQHARTKEAKLQVEYAQLNYLLPRLTGKGIELSRLGGGIGTRGPGETKLEVDRRKIRRKLQKIKKELENIKNIRSKQREKRRLIPVPVIAIAGYTNAGKTMLLNKLTQANLLSEDKLFATLDPKVKSFILPGKYKVLFTDTVGFIKNLPPHLIAAFRSTLEVVKEADVIIHLIDLSNEEYENQKTVVYEILKEINAFEGKKIIEVYNKIDLVDEDIVKILTRDEDKIYISAKTGYGINKLILKIEEVIKKDFIETEAKIDYKNMKVVHDLYENSIIIKKEEKEKYILLKLKCPLKFFNKYKKFMTSKEIVKYEEN